MKTTKRKPIRKKNKPAPRANPRGTAIAKTLTAAARKLGRRGGRARTAKKPKRSGLNAAARKMGRLGGLARKAALSPEQASEIGRRAAYARHGKPYPPPPPPAAVDGPPPAFAPPLADLPTV